MSEENGTSKSSAIPENEKFSSAGKLACGLVHDFNNLLTVMLGRAQLGRMAAANDPKMLSIFNQIASSSEKAAALVRQILVLTRNDEFKGIRFDISVLIGSVADGARSSWGPQFQFRSHVMPSPAFLVGDPVQIEQILMNLLQHALEAMPDGGTVELDAQAVQLDQETAARMADAPAGNYARIAVGYAETGAAAETIGSFEPFVSAQKRGSGVALTVADLLARQHGGFLEVTGSPRKRTAAAYLPYIRQAAPKQTRARQVEAS